MNYTHLSEREKQREIWCVQESQPPHGLKAFAIFPNWLNLFLKGISSLFSIPSPTTSSF